MNVSRTGKGALLSGVIKKSAAEKAGLLKGDIILEVNGQEVIDHKHLSDIIQNKAVGDKIKLEILRGSNQLELEAVLQQGRAVRQFHTFGKGDKKPSWMREWENKCDEAASKPAKCRTIKVDIVPWLGVEIENFEKTGGIIITKVFEETAAEDMGLKKGDIIETVNRVDLNNIDELIAFIQKQTINRKLKINISRQGKKEKVKGRLGQREKRSVVWEDCNKEELLKKAQNLAQQKQSEKQAALGKTRDLKLQSFDLFPNPTAGNFKLKFDSQRASPIEITIVDITGKTIYREFIQDFIGSYHEEIAIEDNPSGTYILQITQDGQVFNQKIILNRNF